MSKIKLAILASGSGTTAEAIIKSGVVDVVLIISNNSQVGIKEKAEKLGIPFEHMPRTPYKVMRDGTEDKKASSLKYGEALLKKFEQYDVTHVSQNGWMIKTPKNVIDHFGLKIINQHPGPLDPPKHPDFGGQGMYGERVHAAVLNFAASVNRPFEFSEATIHVVTAEFDDGPLLMTRAVPIVKGETAETLSMRMLPVEHALQIEFWKKMGENGVESFERPERLILPEEVGILEKAKAMAIAEYPHG